MQLLLYFIMLLWPADDREGAIGILLYFTFLFVYFTQSLFNVRRFPPSSSRLLGSLLQ